MKRISPGTVTVGVLAILIGLVAAYGARRYFAPTPADQAAPKTATVVVPRVNLPQYTRVRSEYVDVVQVPVENVPEGAVRMKSRALLRLVKHTIMAGRPIMEEDLYGVGEAPLLAEQLEPGQLAVTLSVDANSALNGMIQPGSIVDVALTVTNDHPDVGGLATLTVMRRVKVLATSQSRYPATEDPPGQLKNITVAVTSEQANKLILAQRYGTLSVTLRSALESEDDLLAAVSEGDEERYLVNPAGLLGLPDVEPIPEVMARRAEIWRGGEMVEVTFYESEVQESYDATAAIDGGGSTPGTPVAAEDWGPRPGVRTSRLKPSTAGSAAGAAAKGKDKDCPGCDKKKKSQGTPQRAPAGRAAGVGTPTPALGSAGRSPTPALPARLASPDRG